VIEIWQASGGLTAGDYWAKFQNAMETGQVAVARAAMPFVPAEHMPEAQRWMAVTRDPAVVLEQFSQWPYPASDPLIRYGLRLLINQDSVGHAAAFDRIYNTLGRPQSEAWMTLSRQLGVYMTARRHAAGAARLLALAPAHLHDEGYAWLTRYALAQGDCAAVLDRIDSMPAPLNQESVWQYWRAHCLHELGQVEAATAVFNVLAQKREYYGFLAAERLGLPHTFAHQPYDVSPEQRQRLLALVEIQRIQELRATGLQRYARDEWEGLLPQLKLPAIAGAAVLADEWQWPDRAISTLARANIWHDLSRRFPLTYADLALERTQITRLHPAWVLGVMRQESLFQTDVISKARAVGLMQLLPTTATQVAQRIGLSSVHGDQLTSPALNIQLGTAYLRELMDQFGDHPVLATAAYNAGPANVWQWLALPGRRESTIWVETIPFFETRDYLKRVLEYTVIYAWRLSGHDALRLTDFMPAILGVPQ
jgi:soluble lytic murein transglycosylase